jgi:AmmeMemoRadiSam system protein A
VNRLTEKDEIGAFKTSGNERQQLLAIARSALEARVRGERAPDLPAGPSRLSSGVFVTVYCDGALRGCLGTIAARVRVTEAVARLAADVSTEDFRFPPLQPSELARVTIDLSVLTPTEIVANAEAIEVGRDGLIVEQGSRRGLLLPQVAVEHGWDRETFLDQTCVKAGLPTSAWRNGATIRRFQAEVFGEDAVEAGHRPAGPRPR